MKSGFGFLSVLLLIVTVLPMSGQVAVKTNLLYDATLTPNLGVEIGLAPKWSLDISGNFNGWTLENGRRWKHWLAQPEARYWFCDRFSGHFLGFHALGGQYKFGGWKHGFNILDNRCNDLRIQRHQGWYAGPGVAYGYTWILAKHWSLEAELGVGWAYTRYDVYPCGNCGTKIAEKKVHNYVGPTKAAINLIYVF